MSSGFDDFRAQLAGIQDPLSLLEGLFAHSPVPYILFKVDGHPLVTNQAYRDMFGAEPPPEYNVLQDEVNVATGLSSAIRRAFDGHSVQTPTFWYDPKELRHIVVKEANRVAISCSLFPLFGPGREVTHVAIAFKDVTAELQARERAEAERDHLKQVVAHKERLATALRASEERLRDTLQAAEVGTWEWRVGENHVEWSSNIERIFGLASGSFAGTYEAWLELIHPDDRDWLARRVAQALAAKDGYAVEFRFRRPDGSTGWQSTRAEVLVDASGAAEAVRGVVFDVTARRSAEEALKLQARVLENMTEGVSVCAEDGVILYTNAAEDRMFGYAPGELRGQHVAVQNAYPPEDNQRIVAEVIAELKAKGEWSGEWANKRKDGTVFTTRSRITAIDLEGRPHFVCVQEDVTDQVLARQRADSLAEALRTSEARYRTFVGQSTEGIWRFELDSPLPVETSVTEQVDAFYRSGYLAEGNDAMARMYGYDSASALLGKRLGELLVRDDPRNTEYLRAFVESGYRLENAESHELDRAGNRRVFHNSLVGVVERGQLLMAWGTQRDVTAQVEAREQAEAANAAKDEFLALLGHELRNPLSPILTALELMKLRGSDAFQKERAIIERQLKHVVRLVDDLLDISRVTRGNVSLEKQRVDLADTIATAIELTTPLLQQRAHLLSVDVPRGLEVQGDPTRLSQIFANLLMNAAKYTPAKGRIQVRGERIGHSARIRIRDNGVGIRPEMLPRIFERFVQERQALDRSEGGLGLGLAIVRSLVALHGGNVEAESAGAGLGSEFSVYLPCESEGTAETVTPLEAPPAFAGHGHRVLVVDDNRDVAEMLAEALTESGHSVRIAHDGGAALRIIQEFTPEVALLDIGLPVMDGYEVARRIRSQPALAGMRLVAITGYGQEKDRLEARAAGFDHHFVKPVDLAALEQVIGARPQPVHS